MDSSSKQTQTGKDKCWLIRTTQRQLLGPVSKEKILSFLEKGALSPEDELASGNGYWFSVKEKDLIEKYLLGDLTQCFNPISEAPSVLTAPHDQREGTASLHPNPLPKKEVPVAASAGGAEEDVHLPDQDDLEYPDISAPISNSGDGYDFGETQTEDITTVLKLEKSAEVKAEEEKRKPAPQEQNRAALLAEVEEEVHLPDQDDLEYPDMGDFAPASPITAAADLEQQEDEADVLDFTKEDIEEDYEEEAEAPVKVKPTKSAATDSSNKKKGQKRKKKTIEAPQRNDRYLFYLIGLLILLTIGVFYYYKKVLNKPFPIIGLSLSFVLPEAHAQSISPDPLAIKKKDFLI